MGVGGGGNEEGVFRESVTDKCIRRKCRATAGDTGGIERSTVFLPSSTQNDFQVLFCRLFFFFPVRICQTDSEGGKHFNATRRFPKLLQREERNAKNPPIRSLVPPGGRNKKYMWNYSTNQNRWCHLIEEYNWQLFKG